jgi:uncharacterized LabA/DUF88 family protein
MTTNLISKGAGNLINNAFDLNNLRLAVLIDAENVPRNSIKSIMEEVAIYGTPTIKRIYGDWTNPTVSGWKHSLLENAITPIQQYSYTTGKNSSDSAMIIDAMDILYSEKTDGFVIVSSDSDFTRLAIRLREAGQRVIGIGERKTPSAFIAACDKFTYIEVIRAGGEKTQIEQDELRAGNDGIQQENEETRQENGESDHRQNVQQKDKNAPSIRPRGVKVPDPIVRLIADSIADLADDDGIVFMGELGNFILKKQPDFDHRNFGYMSLSAMIKSIDRFETDFRQTADPHIKHVFVRDKEAN